MFTRLSLLMTVIVLLAGCDDGLTSAEKKYNSGVKHQQRGELQESIAEYSESIELGFAAQVVFLNRGHAYYELGRLQEAVDDFSSAVGSQEPIPSIATKGDAFLNRALAYASLGLSEDAVNDLDEAVRIGVTRAASDCAIVPPPTHDWVEAVQGMGVTYGKVSSVSERFRLPSNIFVCPKLRATWGQVEADKLYEMFFGFVGCRPLGGGKAELARERNPIRGC